MKATVNITQREYLDLVGDKEDVGFLTYHARFVTTDPATGTSVIDPFMVKYISSGETAAAFCTADIAALSIEQGTEMTQDRSYKVAGSN
jgi:hypothetical protein